MNSAPHDWISLDIDQVMMVNWWKQRGDQLIVSKHDYWDSVTPPAPRPITTLTIANEPLTATLCHHELHLVESAQADLHQILFLLNI